MTRSAPASLRARVIRTVTNPGCTAGVLALVFIVLRLLDYNVAADVVATLAAVATLVPAGAVLLASPPLPKLHARSLLTERLAWLWRYLFATFVLCTAGVLSVYFSHQFSRQDAGQDREGRLFAAAVEVAQAAAVLGGIIFVLWLVIDLARVGAKRRSALVTVVLGRLRLPTGGRLACWVAFATRPWWVLVVVIVALGPLVTLELDLGS